MFFLLACRTDGSLQLPNDGSACNVDDVEGSVGSSAADVHGNEESDLEDTSQY